MMRIKFFVVFTLFICLIIFNISLLTATIYVPDGNDSLLIKIDALFSRYDKTEIPGAAVAVVKDGKVFYIKGFGCANLEYGIPITGSSVFNMASVSKHVTGFCAVILEKRGKLSFEDDIRKYLPEFPDFGNVIKIKHLLHHTSGLRDPYGLMMLRGWNFKDTLTNDDLIKLLQNQKELNFEPGKQYLYSSSNYVVLSEIIEKITGKSFPDWTKENIFKPLGMKNTFFNDNVNGVLYKNRVDSYRKSGKNKYVNDNCIYSLLGTGNLCTSAEDFALWINNFFDKRIGGAEVIDQMFQTTNLNDGTEYPYTLGLFKNRNYKNIEFYTHDGAYGGFKTYLGIFPEQELGIAVMGNFRSFSPGYYFRKIAEIIIPDIWKDQKKEVRIEEKPVIFELDKEVYKEYAGKYLVKSMNMTIEIKKEDEKLYAIAKGLGRMQLIPESEKLFKVGGAPAKIEFVRNQRGIIDKAVLNSRGVAHDCERMAEETGNILVSEQIAEYCGTYRCEEIDLNIKIVHSDNQFYAIHFRLGDIKLKPVSQDVWEGSVNYFNTLKFFKEQEKIDGFRLSGFRVTNLKFDKIE